MNGALKQTILDIRFFIVFMVILASGCWGDPNTSEQANKIPEIWNEDQKSAFRTNSAETLIEQLTQRLEPLKHRLGGGDDSLDDVFEKGFEYVGPAKVSKEDLIGKPGQLSIETFKWPLSESKIDCSEFWNPVLVGKLSKIKFGVLSGIFPQDRLDRFQMKMVLEAKYDPEGSGDRAAGILAKQTVTWEESDGQWKIHKWKQDSIDIRSATSTLFTDVTHAWLPEDQVQKLISQSPMHNLLRLEAAGEDYAQKNDKQFQFFNDWRSSSQFACVSLVDYDNDGWEDIYLTGGHIRSVLLKNMEGQSFEDRTESAGLLLDPAFANSSLFADFDNDGDADVLVGRTYESSQYFSNTSGQFKPVESVNSGLRHVKFVSSSSAADINRDGLLDVYLSTYCVHGDPEMDWVKQAVAPEYQKEYWERLNRAYHPILDRPGPPNILLANRHGKLEPAKTNIDLQQWRNSYQTAWIDYDSDGDPDLYICNDFAPDSFLRNDTERGSFDFRFTDVTEEVFSSKLMGFGMGVSVGDFDSDADLDLYISNMYSKAGHRVFEQIGGGVSPAVKVAAKGNFLYRKIEGGRFEQIAGFEEGQKVSKVGWSFGGQFADFDNDGSLDIYVPSGLFTPPGSMAAHGDL